MEMNRPRIKKATGKCLQTGPPLETKESEEVQKQKTAEGQPNKNCGR